MRGITWQVASKGQMGSKFGEDIEDSRPELPALNRFDIICVGSAAPINAGSTHQGNVSFYVHSSSAWLVRVARPGSLDQSDPRCHQ